jgi:hypothetical protein
MENEAQPNAAQSGAPNGVRSTISHGRDRDPR